MALRFHIVGKKSNWLTQIFELNLPHLSYNLCVLIGLKNVNKPIVNTKHYSLCVHLCCKTLTSV